MSDARVEDVEFLRHGDTALLARLYRPAGPGPFPAVLEVHGGAWTSGDRLNNVAIAEDLCAAGILVLSIDFRMPPAAPYPAAVADVNYGIRWLKARAASLGSRPELVGGLGTSSGGHLILLSALRPADPRYAALPGPAGVDAVLPWVIACWPVADPLARYQAVQERGNQRLVDAHHQFWPSEADMEDGNPTRIARRREPGPRPPILILQGTADDNLTPTMASDFATAWRAAGGSAELEQFDGQPHAFVPKDPTTPDSVRALTLIKGFIRRHAG